MTLAQDKRVHKSITWISTAIEIAFTPFLMRKRRPSSDNYKSNNPVLELILNFSSKTRYYKTPATLAITKLQPVPESQADSLPLLFQSNRYPQK